MDALSVATAVLAPPAQKRLDIPLPVDKIQLHLLLMRYNALKSQGNDNEELKAIARTVRALRAQHKEYVDRKKRLDRLRAQHKPEAPSALRDQLLAFNLLSRQVDLPESLSRQLLAVVEEATTTTTTQTVTPPADSGPESSDQVFDYKSFEGRARRLGIMSIRERDGVHKDQRAQDRAKALEFGRELVIRNRVFARIHELENLPAALGTFDASSADFEPSDEPLAEHDTLKLRAIIELKSLRLLTKQKSLRQHIVYNRAAVGEKLHQQNSSAAIRAQHRRVKALTAKELRLTEQLEYNQRMEREKKETEARMVVVSKICRHADRLYREIQAKKARRTALSKAAVQAHTQIERDAQRRAERTAKQRLQALRSNDEDAYIKLLDQTKDTRITHLLRQTNSFLDSLAQAVKVQQHDSQMMGHTPAGYTAEEADDDGEKIDYYQVAHRIQEPVTKQPSMLVGGTLKEYQIKGLQWMVSLYNNNLNGILADEMGLGKTIQSISLIAYLYEVKRQPGPYLVIVPLSTLTNWTMEFEKWAPGLKTIIYKGSPNVRKTLQPAVRSGDFQVLLTTYEYIIKDRLVLSKLRWTHMIIDEGHRMKNTQSKLSSTLTQFYYSRHRLILTGTPLQNNLPELWALLNFVLPKIFNSVSTFDEWFNTPFANTGGQDRMELNEEETLLIIRRLHKVLRPFLLRRLKKDVEKDLPDKVEKVIRCKMSALQGKLYDQMLRHNILFVGSTEHAKSGIKGLNNKVMQLRKICNHPFVFEEVENMVNPSHANNDELWRTAGKFELLDRILPKYQHTGHRVLIFFQMTQVMDIMEDYMRLKGMQYLRLDGGTKAEDRSELLKLFNAPDSPYFAFLLSTRAGGLGLNLQTADTVIIYDTDWNPHQDLQAQDRAHRIGQTKEVRILRLITQDSVEEVILSRAHAKLEIDGKVIQAGKFDNKSTAEEQEAFLRSLLDAEEAKRSQSQMDEDMNDEELNDILARSEEEIEQFRELDRLRIETSEYGKDKTRDRLFSYDELPEQYKQDIEKVLEPEVEDYAGRTRERKRVIYDDGLTEAQWMDVVDNDGDLAEAIQQKRDRRDVLRARRARKAGQEDDEEDEEEDEEMDVDEIEGDGDEEMEDGPQSHARATSNGLVNGKRKEDPLVPEAREELTTRCNAIYAGILKLVAEDGHGRADLFLNLPSKSQYPDYYQVVESPVALSTIRKRIAVNHYTSVDDLRKDVDQMIANAETYNEPDSFVVADAKAIGEYVASVL